MLEYSEHLLGKVVPDSERAYQKALTTAYASATERLLATKGIYTQQRLLAVIKEITDELYRINTDFQKALPYDLEVIAIADNRYTQEEMALALEHASIAANLYTLPKETIKQLVDMKSISYFRVDSKGVMHKATTTADAMIKSIANNQAKQVKSIILGEVAQGTSVEGIVRKLSPYMTTQSKRDLRTVTNSLIGEASARTNQKFYTDNSKYINEYLYVATLDSRTSTICRSLDGKRFKTREPHYTPKLHPNCRSLLVAVPEGYTVNQRPIVLPDGTVHIVNDKNFTYADAAKLYPELNNKKLINMDSYINKLKV